MACSLNSGMQNTQSTSGHRAAGRTMSASSAVGVMKKSMQTKNSTSFRQSYTRRLSGRETTVLLAKDSMARIFRGRPVRMASSTWWGWA